MPGELVNEDLKEWMMLKHRSFIDQQWLGRRLAVAAKEKLEQLGVDDPQDRVGIARQWTLSEWPSVRLATGATAPPTSEAVLVAIHELDG